MMKYVVNQGVRETVQELGALFDRFDCAVKVLADEATAPLLARDTGIQKMQIESAIVGCAARLISHATRGRRFPHMTEYRSE